MRDCHVEVCCVAKGCAPSPHDSVRVQAATRMQLRSHIHIDLNYTRRVQVWGNVQMYGVSGTEIFVAAGRLQQAFATLVQSAGLSEIASPAPGRLNEFPRLQCEQRA